MSYAMQKSTLQKQRYIFRGNIPLYYSTLSIPPYATVNCRVGDFTPNYRERLATEWCPLEKTVLNPPLCLQPPPIYYTHLGMVPNFAGHVPGEKFSYGKTYGEETRNAKRYLRLDFVGSSIVPKVEFYKGSGTFTLPNGDVYSGNYTAHVKGIIWREGWGTYYSKDNQTYEGTWRNDRLIDGTEVRITYADGTVYVGPLKKNKYNGPACMVLDSGMHVFANFETNKVVGEVHMADLDGKLWHGVASKTSCYLEPENIFFNNVEKHRGISKLLLKSIEPESQPEPETETESVESESFVDWEKIIFAKSPKVDDKIDFTSSPWFKDFVSYRKQRSEVLEKVHKHEKLDESEAKWYMNYAKYKRMLKTRELDKALAMASKKVDTELLDKYYSPQYALQNKPYPVFYPSYDWVMAPESLLTITLPETTMESVEEELSVEEEMEEEEEEKVEVKEVEEYKEPGMDISVGTRSLYDYVETVTEKSIMRECDSNLKPLED